MADTIAITAGSGTTIATDDVGGIHYQRIKISDGTADSATHLKIVAEDAAHASGDTGIMLLVVRNDAGTALAGTTGDYIPPTTDASGNLRVVNSAALPAGDAVIGRIKLSDGTTVATVRELGANDALNVAIVDGSGNQVVSFGGGTEYTEDAAAAADPVGGVQILVRADTPGTVASTNGDNIAQRGTNYGAAFVQVVSSSGAFVDSFGGSGGTAMADDGAFTAGSTNFTPAGGTYRSVRDAVDDNDGGAFAMTAKRGQYVVVETPNGDSAMDDTADAVKVILQAGTANVGDVDVLTVPADPFGANADAASATGSISAKLRFLAGTGIAGMTSLPAGSAAIGKLAANSGVDIGDVDVTSMPTGANATQVQGTVASGSAAANNPILNGAKAVSAEPAAVDTGDVIALFTDLVGKLITLPYANPENFLAGKTAAITDTTRTAIIAAQGAGVRIYVTHIIVTCSHATQGTVVKIEDGTSEIYNGYAAPAGGGFSVTLPAPLRLTANTALNASCVTTGSSIYVSASGYKGV